MKKLIAGLITLFVLLVTPASVFAATLALSPAVGTFNRGCDMSIKIQLDTTGTQTDGTDVILIYEPSKVSVTTAQITNGSIYPEYPGNNVDAASSKISISGISSVSSPFNGTGTFATINFKVLENAPAGTTTIKFDFNPSNKTETRDSNVVERGTIADVLNSVTDGSYTIGTGQCGTTSGGSGSGITGTGGSGTGSGVIQTKPVDLNPGGKSPGLLDNTILLTSVGVILTILGVAGLAFLR